MTTILDEITQRGTTVCKVDVYSDNSPYVPMPRTLTMLTEQDADLLLAVAEAAAKWLEAERAWEKINEEYQTAYNDIAILDEIGDRMAVVEDLLDRRRGELFDAAAPLLEEVGR